MKNSAIVCAVLAATFGFSSIASAQEWRGGERGHGRDQRVEQRHDRRAQRSPEQRHDRRAERGVERRSELPQRFRADAQGQRPVYRQPAYTYSPPAYRAPTQRFHRGGYLPGQYRSHAYYVNDWHAHPRLYAPPYGQQWVNVDGEFLLVALATGLIVNALLN